MLYLYLFAAVVGGLLLIGSLFVGHGHGHGGGHGHLAGHGHGPQHDVTTATSFQALVTSMRFWLYLLAFGGLTGLLLRLIGEGEPASGIAALVIGAITGFAAHTIIGRASSRLRTGTIATAELVGRGAEVLLPFGRGQTGKVRLRVQSSLVDLLATTDEPNLDAREEVLVVEVKEGVAHVTRSPTRALGDKS